MNTKFRSILFSADYRVYSTDSIVYLLIFFNNVIKLVVYKSILKNYYYKLYNILYNYNITIINYYKKITKTRSGGVYTYRVRIIMLTVDNITKCN